MILVLRDGKKINGVLRSWDQFGIIEYQSLFAMAVLTMGHGPANIVLENAVERIYVKEVYADIPRGVFLVRGENVLLLGEIVCFPAICATLSANA